MTKDIISEVYNMDCIAGMKKYPDKYFDLAIVDPPYGINISQKFAGEKRKSGNGAAKKSAFANKDWDLEIPSLEYFLELFRVSKNQIIWGANYFAEHLPNSMGWIVWDKNNGTTKFADCELAFTSFNAAVRKYQFTWNGMLQDDMKNKEARIHPTQKPISLYDFCIQYAGIKQGDKILDTHLGSGSSRIAAYRNGFHFVGFELDKDYYEAQEKRFKTELMQPRLF